MVTSSRESLLAVASNQGIVDFFDLDSGARVGRVADLPPQPHEMALDSTRRRLYVSHTYRSGFYTDGGAKAHEISVIDAEDFTLSTIFDISPNIAPHDVDYDEHDDIILAGVEGTGPSDNGLLALDPNTGAVAFRIGTEAPNTHWIAVGAKSRLVYATHKEVPWISVLDLTSRAGVGRIAIAGGAEELHLSSDERWVYVVSPHLGGQRSATDADREPGSVPRLVKIDAATGEVVSSVELTVGVSAMRVSNDGRVLVGQLPMPRHNRVGSGSLYVVDGETMSVLANVELGRGPFTTRFSSDSSFACVSNLISGTVSVVDLNDYSVAMTLDNTPSPTWGGSHGLALLNAPGG